MLAHSLSKQANSQRTMPSTDSIPLLSLNNERKHPLPKYGMLWHYVNLSEFTVRQFSVLSQRSRFHFAATCNTATAKVRYAILHVIWGAITTMLNSAHFYFHTKNRMPMFIFPSSSSTSSFSSCICGTPNGRMEKKRLHAIKMNVS